MMDSRSLEMTAPQSPNTSLPSQPEVLDTADKMIDKYLNQDNSFPHLTDKMKLTEQVRASFSGLSESDYPSAAAFTNIISINHIKHINRISLPPEILEQCGNLRTDYRLGLFPEISRAWLAVDSEIYLWNYETGADVAYYDGLNETIVSVGLVKPKTGVFQDFIQHLLVLTTPSEILVIGVLLSKILDNKFDDELQLTPEVIYALPTDSVPITKIFGTNKGRIFLGGRDGCLYEIVYQKEVGWWGKRCKKVNHSKGALSFLVPSFVNSAFYDEDAIVDISVDKSRNVLYTLTEKGAIEVFDLGRDGWGMSRVASVTPTSLSCSVANIIRSDSVEGGLDPGKVVRVCPLEECDSGLIGAVAVTKHSVRLYLTTCNSPRPTTLHLAHVRLPPGYTHMSPLSMRGSTALHAHALSGSFVISTSSAEGTQDKLWCLSGDIYASKGWFSETVTELHLSGSPVSIAEVASQKLTDGKYLPLMVYEHNHTPERIAILTIQGIDVYEKLRPVDVLSEVLKRRKGPDSEEVKNLFAILGADDACAMAVMLACDHWTTNNQVAEWATRAFILYGGEARPVSQPVHLTQHQVGAPLQYTQFQQMHSQQPASPIYPGVGTMQYSAPNLPSCFKPRDVSTPISNKPVNIVETQLVETSHKHNGLYIYLSRILRPVWQKPIVSKIKMADSVQYLVSSLFQSDINRITAQLYALKLFLQKNTQLPPANAISGLEMSSPITTSNRMQEAQLHERHSLDSLKNLVEHSLQVLGLWKLLSEHQFHVLVQSLPQELQQQMPELSFRDLIYLGRDLCYALINSLINFYLNDNTSVDSISNRLREVCPSLFKQEDAACSKANEVLLAAKDETDPEERQAKLRLALKLCKEVAGELYLSQVCRQLIQCNYYQGVIELCHERANRLDPNNLAQHFYAKNQPPDDIQGTNAVFNRLKAYYEVQVMLNTLYRNCHPASKSPSQVPSGQNISVAHETLETVLKECLEVKDEVCHIEVYSWLISKGLYATLVQLGRPSLERFLTRNRGKDKACLRDLLWQYYETTNNHSAAAQVLYTLATQSAENINFNQRLTYLGKAVMCMRSDGCAHHLGVFLHELEDLVQVARIQRQILDKLSTITMRDTVFEEALKKLNSSLLTITELYEEFAEPFNLWECKLTIIECAGHNDRELIQAIWDNIIREEVSKGSSSSPDDQMALVMNKLKSLGLQYTVQSPCFPVAYLVRQLEILSCRLNVNKSHIHSTMTSVGVSVSSLLEIYDRLFTLNDRCWMVEGNEFHLIQVIASFADTFTNNPRMVPSNERRSVVVQMQDLITNCLSMLYSKPETSQLVNYIKSIQTNLDRLL